MSKKELYQAITRDDWKTVEKLVTDIPALLTQPILGNSLLNYAVKKGRKAQVVFLLKQGLSIDFCDGCSPPIGTAVESGDVDLLKWLVEKGADVNVSIGGKPLIYAAVQNESLEMVQILVDHGARLDCTFGIWESPLAVALEADNAEIIAFLRAYQSESMPGEESHSSDEGRKFPQSQSVSMVPINVNKIETALGVKVPAFYRAFLNRFPAELIADNDTGIFHDADRIIASTQSARAYREDDWDGPFPNGLIAVGWNGGGSVYCVKTNDSNDSVYLFEHETGEINANETLSLEQFAALAKSWQS